ncbi:extracellular solute-binding protein [Christensenellaceae bacterium NSJ-44]|uniref:Extracellular solute-binding protein n=1 Tax=Luoshenia tenuis TaxID=2763654 RepID=A0A926CY81_9FIRM|nr:extracellular solute-binding protein [Luoshenia tenuis]MBC8528338.1 extracellular solute-binding protein [Luoshenia tenuis]
MKRAQTRRLAGLLALIAVCALLFGCTGYELAPVVEGGEASASASVYTSRLNVLALTPYNIWGEGLKVFQKEYPQVEVVVTQAFQISNERDAAQTLKLNEEALAQADLVLLPTFSYNYPKDRQMLPDVYKLMEKGAFLDLSGRWNLDKDEGLNQAVLNAGVYRGQRYLVPLTYNIPVLLGGEKLLANLDIDPAKGKDIAGLFAQLSACIPTAKSAGYEECLLHNGHAHAHFPYSGEFGLYDRQQHALADRETVRALCQAYQPYALTDGIQSPYDLAGFHVKDENLAADYYGALAMGKTAFYLDTLSPYLMFEYLPLKTIDRPVLLPLSDLAGNPQAQVTYAMAIPAASSNPDGAYQLIRTLLSDEAQKQMQLNYQGAGTWVNNRVTEEALRSSLSEEQLKSYDASPYFKSGADRQSQPLSQEDVDAYMEIVRSAQPTLSDPFIADLFYESMQPYFEGTADFDICYDNLEKAITAYMEQ